MEAFMTKIDTSCHSNIDHGWIKKNQGEIQLHPAWHEKMSEEESETLLRGNPPFTYILRNGEKEHAYFITYVKMDLSIKHQFFVLEIDRKGWYYRNGIGNGPAEILSKDLEKLIPMMMHCDVMACTPLISMVQT
jgi:hypothetical protein